MIFKSEHMREQYAILPKKLKEICDYFYKLSVEVGVIPVITRVSDPIDGESGVHKLHRAVDFRNEYTVKGVKKWLYPIEVVDMIVEEINKRYPRNDRKKVCIHHAFNNGPHHWHIQIPAIWLTDQEKRRLYG